MTTLPPRPRAPTAIRRSRRASGANQTSSTTAPAWTEANFDAKLRFGAGPAPKVRPPACSTVRFCRQLRDKFCSSLAAPTARGRGRVGTSFAVTRRGRECWRLASQFVRDIESTSHGGSVRRASGLRVSLFRCLLHAGAQPVPLSQSVCFQVVRPSTTRKASGDKGQNVRQAERAPSDRQHPAPAPTSAGR